MAKEPDPEHIAIRLAIADVTLGWSRVEYELFEMLSFALFNAEQVFPTSAIYFAPTSLRARIDIVDRLVSVFIPKLPNSEAFQGFWSAILNAMKKERETRNTVAHGSISRQPKGPNRPEGWYVTPHPVDVERWQGRPKKPKQPTLLSTQRLIDSATRLSRITLQLATFRAAIQGLHAKDPQTTFEAVLRALQRGVL